ncbi:MAG: hypothetical protein IT386_04720, partial [Deltaproteobacteria bacterium]|nr:hypothetical protein [Deltaproteobacteria bacterium]
MTGTAPPTSVCLALALPVDQCFDYAVPSSLATSAEPGRRAIVPFGARRVVGMIVATGTADPGRRLRPVERIVDP